MLIDGLLILAPLSVSLVRRASTPLIATAALVMLIRNRNNFGQQLRTSNIDKVALSGLLLLFGYSVISLVWTPLPLRGAKQLVFDFILPCASGFVLLVAQDRNASRTNAWFFCGALLISGLLVAGQLHFKFRIETLFNPKEHYGELWRFNMVVVTLGLMMPALLIIARREPLLAIPSLAAITLSVALSQSATAKMMLMIGFAVFIVTSMLPRRFTLSLFGATLFILLTIQPWQGVLVEQALRAAGQYDTLFLSAKERIVIWQATGEIALHALPWGTGMGSSDAVSKLPYAQTMLPELWVGLRQTHAHDAFLNVWMELGLPGVLMLLWIAFGILRTMSRLPGTLYAPAMALAAQVVTVDLISHGAWQAWWFTAIMLGILALKNYAPAADQTA
jgi:hypothetical protein